MAFYLKLFGSDKQRVSLDYPVLSEIRRAESHAVAGFSEKRPPSNFAKNDKLFLIRMVKDDCLTPQNDYVVFGRAKVASPFDLNLDRASNEDIKRIPFRKEWPLYLRLKEPEFINGTLRNGIVIQDMIKELGCKSFQRTINWHPQDIRRVFSNQSWVEVTELACLWLDKMFDKAILNHGCVTQQELDRLPKPNIRPFNTNHRQ